MGKNVGTVDRIIRLLVAVVIAVAYLNGALAGVWAAIGGVIAVVFALTALIGVCPLYRLLGISTCPVKSHA